LVLMGKNEESAQFQKNNAFHVCTVAAGLASETTANDVD
jgi:hypothetical protein